MGALIIKDLLLIKSNLRGLIVVLVIFGFMIASDVSNISFMLPLLCMTICLSTFSYDEYYKWDCYAISFPIRKQDIVKTKYIITLLMVLIGFLITVLVTLFVGKDISEMISSSIGGIVGILFVISLMYPVLYKFGMEKGRIMFFAFIVVGSVLLGYIIEFSGMKIPSVSDNVLFIGMGVLVIILLIVSYFISRKIYLKKEF